MKSRGQRTADRGQAFPIYVIVVAGLLFAALAFFVVGQASATRSDAQGAADAAALAAGRAARDDVLLDLDLVSLAPADWTKILEGKLFAVGEACGEAAVFAAKNSATVTSCEPALPRFTVRVETEETVGESVIPGTESMHGTATATALIKSKCRLGAISTPSPSPTPTATPTPSTPAGGGTAFPPTPSPATVTFECGGESVKLDPLKPGSLSELTRRLFSVRLVG
ncbi:pilus assembly protein TadG-related protein [Streptomyces erythrochromogenes]|uniref:pilus assembly protein TadG-related protein n=1 Tax=Streptomyces erythrochromogenes TaxID=285574 RepID=UPI002254F0D0|nr:pilus assembly protein TadG-related protein [Streptomyces erythrochromogenes]MCX5584798.1 pilus assembly protein TadG-related protein [Streptomyces erythrochromogenes]